MASWLADQKHGPAPAWVAQADSTVAVDALLVGRYGACAACGQRGTFVEALASLWYGQRPADGSTLALAYVICPRCAPRWTQIAPEVERRLCDRYGIPLDPGQETREAHRQQST
jgi:hypothetical protein